jgi:hypothetical protein
VTYLAVFEDATWHVERSALIGSLARDWPDADVQVGASDAAPSDEARDVVWTYTDDGGAVEGYSHADGTCIYLEGPIELVARFAIWYRGLVPERIRLVFCDDGYNFDGVIEANSTVSDVVAISENA